jgi:uncharacterized protein YndB with AHSA1/START domain
MAHTDQGYLLIADITGYTRFMQGSELDHARGILEGLFKALLAELQSPFVLSNVQGDAILAHARDPHVSDGHAVLDTVESLYFGFARELEHMILNTTCKCQACSNMADLDLKLLIHHGAYAEQEIAGRKELSGTEVILIHRLMKNTIAADAGIRAYAAFTEAAAEAINVADFFAGLTRHVEAVEGFPDVSLSVLDMQPRWEAQKSREVVVVEADDGLLCPEVAVDLPATPQRCWHYVNDPELRAKWVPNVVGLTRSKTESGRLTAGTVDHCAHGDGKTSVFTFIDVRPYDHVTFDIAIPLGGSARMSIVLEPKNGECRVAVRVARPAAPNVLSRTLLKLMSPRMAPMIHDHWRASFDGLKKLAEADPAAAGPDDKGSTPPDEALKAAADARLSR